MASSSGRRPKLRLLRRRCARILHLFRQLEARSRLPRRHGAQPVDGFVACNHGEPGGGTGLLKASANALKDVKAANEKLKELLIPFPPDRMKERKVSKKVGDVKNRGPEVQGPFEGEPPVEPS